MKNKNFKEQKKIALLLVLWRIPEFVTSFIAASTSQLMVVWLEFIECASILIPGLLLIILSSRLEHNLKFKFNYGTGRIEAITALCCEVLDIVGLFCVVFFSVKRILKPQVEHSYLNFALVVSVIGVVIDAVILIKQKKLLEGVSNRMFHTAYISAVKEFGFDFLSIITLIMVIVFGHNRWIQLFPPVVSILIAIPFALIVIEHMKESISELIDRTLDEENQLKILKVLGEFYDSYEELYDIKSRIYGENKIIDLAIGFRDDYTFAEIKQLKEKIEKRIVEEIDNCTVNIIL
ncbi:MAG: cation transporter [Pseudobutyrivibrio sp.]|nr:cation transporter [Pseudobutyrivibrio sp.]